MFRLRQWPLLTSNIYLGWLRNCFVKRKKILKPEALVWIRNRDPRIQGLLSRLRPFCNLFRLHEPAFDALKSL